MGGILGKEGSPAKQRWGKLAKTITKFKEPEAEEENQHLQIHNGVGQERQSFRFVFYIFSAMALYIGLFKMIFY